MELFCIYWPREIGGERLKISLDGKTGVGLEAEVDGGGNGRRRMEEQAFFALTLENGVRK